jgi:hypothetical protein
VQRIAAYLPDVAANGLDARIHTNIVRYHYGIFPIANSIQHANYFFHIRWFSCLININKTENGLNMPFKVFFGRIGVQQGEVDGRWYVDVLLYCAIAKAYLQQPVIYMISKG